MKNIKTNRIDKEKLIEYYKKNGNAIKTGIEFGLSGNTVLKIVRSYGVSVIGEYKKYTDEYIISKYHEYGTAKKTGIELGIGDERVMDVLDRNNVERKKIKHIEVGNVYHKLTVIEFVGYHVTSGGEKNKTFLCKCECGGTREVVSSKLTATKKPAKDCGCTWKLKQETAELKRVERDIKKKEVEEIREQKRMERELNKKPPTERKYKVGYKHNKLTILSEIGTGDDMVFTVECECGTIKEVRRLTLPTTKSCGCLQKERSYKNGLFTRNNKEKELMYARYKNMKRRCYNEKNDNYPNYGGRGIIVCDRWLEPKGMGFVNFCNDIGPRPSSKHSIDRINNDGNYEPTNCRWATNSEQVRNQRKRNKK